MKAVIKYMGFSQEKLVSGAYYEIFDEDQENFYIIISQKKTTVSKSQAFPLVVLSNHEYETMVSDLDAFKRPKERSEDACEKGTTEDLINKPNHYHIGGFDIYEIMQAKFTPEEYQGFCKGNILKYNLREAHKGGLSDLKKARFNQERLIESREGITYIPEHKKNQ